MKKLNLPIIKGKIPYSKRLSMNDYLKFVYLQLKYTFNRDASRKWKKLLEVNTPFSIKD